jgi:hypothetical protein
MRRLVLLAVLALAVPAAPVRGENPLLVATVGPEFTIDLADANGRHVDTLTAGSYTLLVHDRADIHDFHLANKPDGAKLDLTSGVEFVGDKTFTIDLTPGRYAYACTPHWQVMNGSFVVIPASTPPASPTTRHALAAGVAPGGALTLSSKRVVPGAYRITVRDRSRTKNFHLVGQGVDRRTAKAFVGTAVWAVDLATGVYRFGSDPRLSGRLIVA